MLLPAFFLLTSLCIHRHQEMGCQLSMWIYIIYPFIHSFKLAPGNLGKLRLLCTSCSLDFGSCFTFNLPKLKPKYCLKKILHEEKLHFSISFSFETQFEMHQNDPGQGFEGDIFAQTEAIPQWRTLDQTLYFCLG